MGGVTKDEKGLPANHLRICIDHLTEDVGGRVFSRLWSGPLLFGNYAEMLLKTDAMFDEKGIPQTFQQKRSFTEGPEPLKYNAASAVCQGSDGVLGQQGEIATLDVIVRTRHSAGWQGIVRSSSGKTQEFQSEMELLKCILDIAGKEGTKQG